MQSDGRSGRSFRRKQQGLVLSLDVVEIEPTQLSYPCTPCEHLAEQKREQRLADMVQLVRRAPSTLSTTSPKAPLTSRSSKTCFFSEATDDTDEIVTPRAPRASLLLPPSVRSSRQAHHKNCFSFPVQEWEKHQPPEPSAALYLEAVLRGHRNTVTCAEIVDTGLVSASSDYSLKLWELRQERRCLRATCVYSVSGHKSKVACLATVSPALLCSAAQDPVCALWAVTSLKIKKVGRVTLPSSATSLLCPSPLTLLSGAAQGCIYVSSLEAVAKPTSYNGHSGAVTDLASTGPTTFLSAGFDATIRLWDFRTRTSITVLREHADTVNRLLQWDEYAFLSASDDCTIKKWDSRTCTVVQTLTSSSAVRDLVRVRQRLVSSGDRISVWNGREATTWSPHSSVVTRLAYATEKDLLVAGSYDATLSILRPYF